MKARVPFVPQMEMAECGAACVAMVLGHFGCHVPLAELRVDCGVGRDGLNARGMLDAAARHGLEGRAFTISLAQLAKLSLPAIAHWDFNHFVVIDRVTTRGASLLDPAVGRKRLSWAEIDQHFTGVVLTFTPSPTLRPRAQRAVSLRRYWSGLFGNRRAATLLFSAALLLQLLMISVPSAGQVMIDHVLPPQRINWLWALLGIVAAASVARVVFTWVRGRTLALLYIGLDLDLMGRFTDKLFALPATFFDQRTPGDLLQRVQANTQLSELGAGLITAALDSFVVFVLTALMLAYHPGLAALTLLLSLARVGAVGLLQQRIRQGADSELTLRGSEASVLVDAFSMPELVRAFGLRGSFGAKHTNCTIRRTNLTLSLRRDTAKVMQASVVIEGLTRALLLYIGGTAVLSDQLSIGAFVAILTLHSMLDAPLSGIVQASSQITYVKGLLTRLSDVMDARSEHSGDTRLEEDALRGELSLDAVSFQYSPRAPKVCDGLSLRVAAGEKVAIVGRSGSGKSTLAKLLVGLIRPDHGQARIDGVPLTQLDGDWLRRRIGVVLQEPFLFDESVRANIDLHEARLSAETLDRVLRLSCLEGVVQALPRGLATCVGERGRLLSGGQRQRLMLARALAHDPAVLLLDEATSSLDPETEATVHANLAQLGCTRIVVAHRLATIRDADRILVLERGKLVQQGTFDQLSQCAGPFQSLMCELS